MECLLGVDVGTSGTRAALVALDGKIIDKAYTNYDYRTPAPNWVEQDADVYWSSVCKVLQPVKQKIQDRSAKIVGLAVSGLAPDSLAVGKDGQPLYPAILWMDRRATKEEQWLKESIGADSIYKLTGNVIDPYYGLLKTLWLKNNRPDIYRRAGKIINVTDFIVSRLTGNFVTDYCHGACTGIAFDIRRRQWDQAMLQAVGIEADKLPELQPADSIAGYVTKEAASQTGLTEGIPVAVGTTDGLANITAAGIREMGENVISLGTSYVWGVLCRAENLAPKMLNVPGLGGPDSYLTIAALAFTGGLYKWLRDYIYQNDTEDAFAAMDREAEKIQPGCGGLLTLPYFAGERTPIWDSYARGVFFGLAINHSAASLFRSALEGVALALLDNLKRMREAGLVIKQEMIVTGGGAKSALLRKILADVLGLEITFVGGDISAEIGDAFIAGKAVKVYPDYQFIKKTLPVLAQTSPDSGLNKYYDRVYEEVYRELYPRLKELYLRIAKINNIL
jgi:sugar (pentulose or hexulose) kinase